MKLFRAILRSFALVALSATAYLAWATGRVFFIGSNKESISWRNFIFRTWARGVVLLARIKITLRGSPPAPPFFLVSNHLSYIDVIVIAAHADCVFVAKKDVSSWPVIGFLCAQMNTIFVDRESRRDVVRVNALIEKALAEGRGVVLFAEGTSTEGATVAPFNPSLLHHAAKTSLPVSYAAVSYRVPEGETPAHLSVCWWGDMTFAAHLFGLFQLPSVYATLSFGPEPIRSSDRKLLASELRRAVEGQFIPVVDMEEMCSTTTR
jgi:1-acyl-sn-glycerol-3-phosphate acyltransferase